VLASRAANRFGVPALLIFLAIGMLTGSDGPGGIPFDQPEQAQNLGVVALIFIMFAGGLETDWRHTRPVLWPAVSLATVGVFLSTVLFAWVTHVIVSLDWKHSLLLGAMISSTDAAALFSVLKSQGIRLKGRLIPLLELESGTNDPMALFLTVGMVAMLTQPDFQVGHLLIDLPVEMGVGAALGYAFGLGASRLVQMRLPSSGMLPVLSIATLLISYSSTSLAHGSGFLAVYVTGIVMGNVARAQRAELLGIHDGLAWLMQISMFLVLGLQVFPSELPPVMSLGLCCALFLCFIARPLSVFAALAFSGLSWREKLLVSWMGLRGAVPIILATYPLLARMPEADVYFNVVFFAVITSVMIQGPTIPWLARKLDLIQPHSAGSHESSG